MTITEIFKEIAEDCDWAVVKKVKESTQRGVVNMPVGTELLVHRPIEDVINGAEWKKKCAATLSIDWDTGKGIYSMSNVWEIHDTDSWEAVAY